MPGVKMFALLLSLHALAFELPIASTLLEEDALALSESYDSVMGIEILHPANGSIERSPVRFKTTIHTRPGDNHLFVAQYKHGRVCIEANDEIIHCSPLDEPRFQYHHLGNCTARVYLVRSGLFKVEDRNSYWQSDPIVFTLMTNTEFNEHVDHEIAKNHKMHRSGYLQSHVEWAQTQQRQPDEEVLRRLQASATNSVAKKRANESSTDPILIVGVRTAVVSHFPFRQAIRETWASQSALPQDVKVFFLGCRPHAVMSDEDAQNSTENPTFRRIWEAIELEKQVYGDLLTDELDCDDSYGRLADKTKEFLHFASTNYSNTHYVMVADDDLYLRLDNLAAWLKRLGPLRRFYFGHVRAIESLNSKIPPNRNPSSRHYLSKKQYPLNELPPFALGANFFLSMDCARFASKNRHRLRDLGGMDDISTALWMLTIQVHPNHLLGLEHLNWGPCKDDLVALSDLSVSAIRLIHANVLSERQFCHGFEWSVWMRKNIGVKAEGRPQLLSFTRESLHFEFSYRRAEEARVSEFVVTISTPTQAGIKILYAPFQEIKALFSSKVCAQIRLHFPGSAGIPCSNMIEHLQTERHDFYEKLKTRKILSTSDLTKV